MLRSNRGDYIDDHQNARLTQAGAAGFGCFHNLLWTLTVPSFTVEVFLRTRMGWIYVLINTIWGSLFLALCVLVTKLEDPSILVFALLFWAAALVRLVSFFAIREQIHAYSCGMPLRLWSRIVGTGAAAQPLTLILGEPILVGCVGQLLSVFGLRASGDGGVARHGQYGALAEEPILDRWLGVSSSAGNRQPDRGRSDAGSESSARADRCPWLSSPIRALHSPARSAALKGLVSLRGSGQRTRRPNKSDRATSVDQATAFGKRRPTGSARRSRRRGRRLRARSPDGAC